jgi:BA14K-like protein
MIRASILSILIGSSLIVPAVAQGIKSPASAAFIPGSSSRLNAVAVSIRGSLSRSTESIGPTFQNNRNVETIQYRGRYHGGRGGGYRGYSGRDAGIGIGALIIGGIILSEAARAQHRSDNGDDWQRCADTFRSFEPSTGMYTGYDGIRRTCPYLN